MTAWHGAQKTEVVAHFVGPSPAAHVVLTALKAGESVFQTLLLTKVDKAVDDSPKHFSSKTPYFFYQSFDRL